MRVEKLLAVFFTVVLGVAGVSGAWAKGSDLKFGSSVISVSQTDTNEGSLEVTIHDVTVAIIVNGDTEIEESGEEIGLADVSAGDFVGISAFFTPEGIVADEIKILDVREEQFRLRGAISAVDAVAEDTVITLLGVDVAINADTSITRRGSGDGNAVPVSELAVDDLVNVSGTVSEGLLIASRIYVGTREQGNIELEGEILSATDTELSVSIEGGTTISITIDDDTSVAGELAVGVFVEVEGQLLSDLSLLAFEIAADVDGDGDADDDNRRGRRGDEHSNNGRGNSDDDDDDDSDDDNSDSVEVGAEIILAADGTELNGKAEYSYEHESGQIEQELEIEIEDATPGSEYAVLVFFDDESVEFGTFTSNSDGDLEIEFSSDASGDDENEVAIADLLPEGKDVRDISSVQILQDGSVLVEGNFE